MQWYSTRSHSASWPPSTMWKLYRSLHLVPLLLLLLLLLQPSAYSQSVAEISAVTHGGQRGAGTVLPYSSPFWMARSAVVNPPVLLSGGSNPADGPVYVGPTSSRGTSQRFGDGGSSRGPVFHNVFQSQTGVGLSVSLL